MKKYFWAVFAAVSVCIVSGFTVSCSYHNGDDQVVHPDNPDPEPDPVPEPLPDEYLRALAFPNAYMVKPGSVIVIPVMKAYAVWAMYGEVLGEKLSRKATLSASLLWQDNPGLVTDISLTKDEIEQSEITVSVADGKQGNAVVAFKLDGMICWSWHIWATGYDPDAELVQQGKTYEWDNNGDGVNDYVFMDRNLGALSDGTLLTRADSLAACGLLYQWGRKDPFPGSAELRSDPKSGRPDYNSRAIYDQDGNVLEETGMLPGSGIYALHLSEDLMQHNLYKTITRPMTLLIPDGRNGDTDYKEWYLISKDDQITDNALWATDSGKGVFDPCPAGWRVPPYKNKLDPWKGFDNATSPYSTLGVFPYTGVRDVLSYPTVATLSRAGRATCIWSSTPNSTRYVGEEIDYGNTRPCYGNGFVIGSLSTCKSMAASVRCSKE